MSTAKLPSCLRDQAAQAVAIRVRGEDQMGVHLLGQGPGQIEGGIVFRIGRGAHGGEIRVGVFLLGHHVHVLKAHLGQDAAHGHVPEPFKGE